MSDFHFATLWEAVADQFPQRQAGICDGQGISWRDYEQRASRIAALLQAHGLGADAKAGLYLHNSNYYHEAQFGIFKVGGCPINVNYRYKADELVYLLDNADVEAIFFQACYAMRIWEIKDRLPKVKLFVQISDGTEALLDFAVDYERAVRDNEPAPRIERDPESVYLFYTGGTTGLPKGVMYPVGGFANFFLEMGAQGRGLTPPRNMAEYPDFLASIEAAPITVVGCPLMHGTGMWLGGFLPHLLGGTSVTTAKLGLDPDRLWGLVETHRATELIIVGDAFAKPLLEALDFAKRRGTPYNLSSLTQIASSGVMWSEETKQALLAHHDMVLADIMGSTEGGMGSSITTRETGVETARFALNDGVKVITDAGEEVEAGSGQIGKIATSSFVPLGYYKDPEKSAATFKEIDGVRYSFPGDYATVEADGSITLLGRGSVCINTAGEKVFPEEVEEAVKRHADVYDCLVVGVADDKFGERVVALYSSQAETPPDDADVLETARTHLAGYKAPKQAYLVPEVRRAANGKADYKWARKEADRLCGV